MSISAWLSDLKDSKSAPEKVARLHYKLEEHTDFLLTASDLMRAEKLETELEELYTKRCSFQVSPVLSDAFEEALLVNRREDIKKLAFRTITNISRIQELAEGMRLAEQIAGLKEPVLAAFSGNTVLFFKCSEEEALQKFASLREIRRQPNPKKVLVKMITQRMSKLYKEICRVNTVRSSQRERDEAQKLVEPKYKPYYDTTPMPMPEFSDPASVRARLPELMSRKAYTYGVPQYATELFRMLAKDGITDEIIYEAGKIIFVEEIMTQ